MSSNSKNQTSPCVDIKTQNENEENIKSDLPGSHPYDTETQKELENLKNSNFGGSDNRYNNEATEETSSQSSENTEGCRPNRKICIPAAIIAIVFIVVLMVCVILLIQEDDEGLPTNTIEFKLNCFINTNETDRLINPSTCDEIRLVNEFFYLPDTTKISQKQKKSTPSNRYQPISNLNDYGFESDDQGYTHINITFKAYMQNVAGMFKEVDDIVEVKFIEFHLNRVTTMSEMFRDCPNLEKVYFLHSNSSYNKNLSGLFYNCTNLKEVYFGELNTTNVTTMDQMFYGCENLYKLDNITALNTSSLDNMTDMFTGTSSLTSLDLSAFSLTKIFEEDPEKIPEKIPESIFEYTCTGINENLTTLTISEEDYNKAYEEKNMTCDNGIRTVIKNNKTEQAEATS